MVMDYIKNRGSKDLDDQAEVLPEWVSSTNKSIGAWEYVEEEKKNKIFYIKTHGAINDYKTKLRYQIKASEVAREIGITRSTLMHASTYSEGFSAYLLLVNKELEHLKDEKLKRNVKNKSRGTIRHSKDDLVNKNKELKKELSELKRKNMEELARRTIDLIPLPMKRKMGIT